MPEMQFVPQSKQEIDILLQNVPNMRYGIDFTIQQLTRFVNRGKRWKPKPLGRKCIP
jgi:hypothetical protein